MKDLFSVKMSRKALKDLKKVPDFIAIKLQSWIDSVGHYGLSEAKRIPGYHDEALRGKRSGQRSIRLNIAYRAIYRVDRSGVPQLIEIIEVNKHEY